MLQVDLKSSRTTLADLAYQHLLNAILSNDLRPGDRLRPDELASQLGISPTPVKHALARLSGEGLVQFTAGLAPSVSVPTENEIKELYDCRLMCEIHAVREGIHLVDEPFLSTMKGMIKRCDEDRLAAEADHNAKSRQRMAESDSELHLHLLSLSRNQIMIDWYRRLNLHIKMCRVSIMLDREASYRRVTQIQARHQAIYDALANHDVDAATEAIRSHIMSYKQMLSDIRGLDAAR